MLKRYNITPIQRFLCSVLVLVGVLGFATTNQAQRFIDGPFIAWHPDGLMLAVAQEDHIEIVNVETGQTLNIIPDIDVGNNGSAWSPDGTMLAIVDGSDVQVWSQPWDPNLSQQVATFQYYADWTTPATAVITAVAWSPDSTRVAASSGEFAHIWNITNDLDHAIHGEWMEVTSLVWTSDNRLALTSNNSMVAIINPNTGEPITQYYEESGSFPIAFTSLAFSPDGDQAAFGDQYGAVAIWENTRTTDYWVYSGVTVIADVSTSHGDDTVRSVSWHPGGHYLASGGWDGTVRIWDVDTRQLVEIIEVGEDVQVNSVAWSPDGSQLAYVTPDGYEIIPAPGEED